MRKAIIAAAAACMVMGSTRADTEPTNFVRIVTYVVTATGAVKAAFEVYDWVTARWFPPPQQFQAGDLWLCGNCQFPPPSRGSQHRWMTTSAAPSSRSSSPVVRSTPGKIPCAL